MTLAVLVQRDRNEAARSAGWLGGRDHTLLLCGGPSAPASQYLAQGKGSRSSGD